MNRARTRRIAALAAAALTAATLTGCTFTTEGFTLQDNGTRTTEAREITDVSTVRLASAGTMRVSVGTEPSLTITAGDAIMDRITTETLGTTLEIDLTGRWAHPGRIEYDLVLPHLSTVVISGSGVITGALGATDRVAVEISGSGDITLEPLDVSDVAVTISGSGSVTLDGRTDVLAVAIPGSGDFSGAGLSTRAAVVSMSGSGQALVDVAETLEASIAGSGQISYLGDPRVTSTITGSGHVGRA